MSKYYLEGPNSSTVPVVRLVDDNALMIDIKGAPNEKVFTMKDFEISGLALEFSRLSKDKHFLEFANKYGLLGLNEAENLGLLAYDVDYLVSFKLKENSAYEILDEWKWHVSHVKRLLKLFSSLQNLKPIKDKILLVDNTRDLFAPPQQSKESMSKQLEMLKQVRSSYEAAKSGSKPQKKDEEDSGLHVYWAKREFADQPTLLKYRPPQNEISEEEEFRRIAWRVLESHIIAIVEKGVFIDFYAPRADKKSAVGFSFADRKATNHLVVAIYYDLYKIVNNIDSEVSFCEVCQGAFQSKRKGTLYCSNACRQENKRNKHEETDEEKE